MLKITIDEFPDKQRWSLQRRLVGQWADELSATWRERHHVPEQCKCIVELMDVTFIDRSGPCENYEPGRQVRRQRRVHKNTCRIGCVTIGANPREERKAITEKRNQDA
jgi:hypothetical protein